MVFNFENHSCCYVEQFVVLPAIDIEMTMYYDYHYEQNHFIHYNSLILCYFALFDDGVDRRL